MKKLISAIWAVVLCASLTACGVNEEDVDKALQGKWEYSWYAVVPQWYCYNYLEFDDGVVTNTFISGDFDPDIDYGVYSVDIDDEVIIITYQDKTTQELSFTYEDGELTLVDYGDGSVKNEYKKID